MFNEVGLLQSASLVFEQHWQEILFILFISIAGYALGIKRVRDRINRSERGFLANNIFQIHLELMDAFKADATQFGIVTRNPLSIARSNLDRLLLFCPSTNRKSKIEGKLERYFSDVENLERCVLRYDAESDELSLNYFNAANSVSELLSLLNKENDDIWKKIPLQARTESSRLSTLLSLGAIPNVSSG